jgi:hypothetical protein
MPGYKHHLRHCLSLRYRFIELADVSVQLH